MLVFCDQRMAHEAHQNTCMSVPAAHLSVVLVCIHADLMLVLLDVQVIADQGCYNHTGCSSCLALRAPALA